MVVCHSEHSFCTDFSVLELYLADSGKIVGHPGIPCIQKICILCAAYILHAAEIVRVV